MKGYKAFDKNLQCRGFQFEVGKTYKHEGEIELCESGFHFCEKCVDCFGYYNFDKNIRICEIEALGNVKKSDNDSKCVTDEIKIVHELTWDEVLRLCNSGNRNSGNRNSGDWNSGNRNSGDWNSGYSNSGDWNSGGWNSGNRNSGYLNTTEPPVRIFDKDTSVNKNDLLFPNFFFFDLIEWIESINMSEKEQIEHPSWQITGGYLKIYSYKEAWRKSFEKAKTSNDWENEKKKLLAIPNFDYDKFEQISGISQQDIEG